MPYVNIVDGKVVGYSEGNQQEGWSNDLVTDDDPRVLAYLAPPENEWISATVFFDRLGSAADTMAANPAFIVKMIRLAAAGRVKRNDPEVIAQMGQAVAAGIITQALADQLLAP